MNPQDTSSLSNPLPTPPATPFKMGKFAASKLLVKESFNVLKQDKELAWFPVVTGIVQLIGLIILASVFFFVIMGANPHYFDSVDKAQPNAQLDLLGYAVLFVYYLMTFFIANYFLAGVYAIVHARFNGGNLSFGDGIDAANRNIGKIFAWSFISATVGVVLRVISDKSQLIGKIVAGLFGAAWAILTYFSLPSLVIGNRSVQDSFKESAALIRKTWGEAIIVNFGLSLFFMVLTFIVMALFVGVGIIVQLPEVWILLAILFVIYMIAVVIISSTLDSIVKLALYEYASTGKVPQGFTPELIQNAVKGKV